MFTRRFSSIVPVTLLAAVCLPLSGCDTPTGQGAGIGAASGAIIGGLATNRVGGAALGAVAGAGAGALIGGLVQADQEDAYGPRPGRGYPTATPTGRRGFVLSPYAPYKEIQVFDEEGHMYPHGVLVSDPNCHRLFVNP